MYSGRGMRYVQWRSYRGGRGAVSPPPWVKSVRSYPQGPKKVALRRRVHILEEKMAFRFIAKRGITHELRYSESEEAVLCDE